MATRAFASGVINYPIEVVWKQIRQFDFPARLLTQTIAKVELEEHANATTVGGGMFMFFGRVLFLSSWRIRPVS
jgi:hypothetical protein